ncbi:MAG: hypothetical protein ACREYC_28080 [Gammaproteobacteria bacterium]
MGQKKRKKEQRSAPNAATLELPAAAQQSHTHRRSRLDPAVQQLLKELRRGADAER